MFLHHLFFLGLLAYVFPPAACHVIEFIPFGVKDYKYLKM